MSYKPFAEASSTEGSDVLDRESPIAKQKEKNAFSSIYLDSCLKIFNLI